IKELYIARAHRSRGVGKLLMKTVAIVAARAGCGMIKWWVAKWNERGVKFYKRLGANIDSDWHEFQLSETHFVNWRHPKSNSVSCRTDRGTSLGAGMTQFPFCDPSRVVRSFAPLRMTERSLAATIACPTLVVEPLHVITHSVFQREARLVTERAARIREVGLREILIMRV